MTSFSIFSDAILACTWNLLQFEKAANSQNNMLLHDEEMEESEDEDVDEVRYGLEDESQTSSDNDD